MRFGICCGAEHLPTAAKAGADYIELALSSLAAISDEEFESLCIANGFAAIKCESCNGMLPGEIKLIGAAYDEAVYTAYLDKAYGRAAKLGIKVIVFGSGSSRRIPEGYDREQALTELVHAARLAGDYAARYGLMLAMEPLNTKECNVFTTSTETFEFVKRVDHPNVKLLVDLYHFAYEKEPFEALAQEKDVLIHTHIATCPGRKWPTQEDALIRRFITELNNIGYEGRVSLEGGCDNFGFDAVQSMLLMKGIDAETRR